MFLCLGFVFIFATVALVLNTYVAWKKIHRNVCFEAIYHQICAEFFEIHQMETLWISKGGGTEILINKM